MIAESVWAVGDLHGNVGCARHWVQRTGLLNNVSAPPELWTWMDAGGKLIFLGDYIDKGPDSRAVMEFVRALTTRFPKRVTALLGNHELNLLMDRTQDRGDRYLEFGYAAAHPGQYSSWLPETDPASSDVVRALHAALLLVYQRGMQGEVQMTPDGPRSIVQFVQPPTLRATVSTELGRWQTAYLRGVSTRSPLGSWLHRPLTAFLADTVFVHGGIAPGLLTRRLPATRSAPSRPLNSLAALSDLNTRWLNATSERPGKGTDTDAEVAEAASLAQSEFHGFASEMVEYRGFHEAYAGRYKDRHSLPSSRALQVGCDRVDAVLQQLNASRIAVGHTPDDNVRIKCGGRLLALDSTLSRHFRAHGNYYCDEEAEKEDPRICRPRKQECEGQIVRLQRAGPQAAWALHVVQSSWGEEHEEGLVEESEHKVEL